MGNLSSKPTSRRCSGFTFLEVVIAMVIVGILGSALARFVDFDAANKAAADLGYQAVEARWKTIQVEKIADTVSSKSAAFPSLADLSGYVQASASEPAPDTAPVLVDWRWEAGMHRGFGYAWASYPSGQPLITSDFRCDPAANYISPAYRDSAAVFMSNSSSTSAYYLMIHDYVTALSGQTEDSPLDSMAPHCEINYSFSVFQDNRSSWSSTLRTWPDPWGMKGTLTHWSYSPVGYTRTTSTNTVSNGIVSSVISPQEAFTYNLTNNKRYQTTPQADSYRLDCSSYQSRYGTEYRLAGVTHETQWNGMVTSGWKPASDPVQTTIQTTPFTIRYNDMNLAVDHGPTAKFGRCERVGPAPALPPATDGNPGNPPPKADLSGLCVAKGWSVATFKADGAPTSAATDLVARISSPTEDSSCE